jgi:dTDP-glucose pyrophosphorylase
MIILVPMGGKGSRFSKAGYKTNKASILTTDRHTGVKLPMVVCAMKDIPGTNNSKNKIVCIDRELHQKNGTEEIIRKHFKEVIFIHDHIMLDQGYACFLAREYLNSNDELFIGACDNGIEIDLKSFELAKERADVLMISHTNDQNIYQNPEAHSWAELESNSKTLSSISLKKTVSKNPMSDHATTGMFWFKHANLFLKYLKKMIEKKDMLEGKYYVDKVIQYFIDEGFVVQYFDVKYLCWGTPKEYEDYEEILKYWNKFYNNEKWLKKSQ